MAKKGLGRGLGALLSDNLPDLPDVEVKEDGRLVQLHISDVEPNRKQPRKHFDENALMELAESIGMHGLLEPIAVRKKNRAVQWGNRASVWKCLPRCQSEVRAKIRRVLL